MNDLPDRIDAHAERFGELFLCHPAVAALAGAVVAQLLREQRGLVRHLGSLSERPFHAACSHWGVARRWPRRVPLPRPLRVTYGSWRIGGSGRWSGAVGHGIVAVCRRAEGQKPCPAAPRFSPRA